MSSAPPSFPQKFGYEPQTSPASTAPRQVRVTSGTWVVVGVVFLGIFVAIGGWLYQHNQQRKPLDFWGFDSHRIIRTCPSIQATLIKPDPLVLTPQTPGNEIWHDNLFMIVENRYLVERRVDVVDRPEFRLKVINTEEVEKSRQRWEEATPEEREEHTPVKYEYDDFDPEGSLRRALRTNRSYDWKAFPWAQEPEWRYALTFAQTETTYAGTKHELNRTFTFTLVFDVTCRWVTLQSVNKLTALEPSVQQRFKKFFLDVFPGSDVPTAAPTPTPVPTATSTPTGIPVATGGPTPTAVGPTATSPAGTGMTLGGGTVLAPQTPATPAGAGSMTSPAGSGASPPPLQLSPNPLLQPSSVAPPPIGTPSGTIILPNFPTTTSTAKP